MTNPITVLTNWYHLLRRKAELKRAPQSISEALDRLIAEVPLDALAKFKVLSRKDCICGFSWGSDMALRNSWGLWTLDTGVARELDAAGIKHGDDRSSVLFTALWCRINNAPFDLKKEAAYYAKYWRSHGCNPPMARPWKKPNAALCLALYLANSILDLDSIVSTL